ELGWSSEAPGRNRQGRRQRLQGVQVDAFVPLQLSQALGGGLPLLVRRSPPVSTGTPPPRAGAVVVQSVGTGSGRARAATTRARAGTTSHRGGRREGTGRGGGSGG